MPPDETKPAQPLVRRDAKGRLLAGSVMNPHGRPRTGLALAETIREVMSERGVLRELINLALDIALLRPVSIDTDWLIAAKKAREAGQPDPPRQGQSIQPNIAESQRAWDFLAQWGYRKPPTEVEITASSGEPIGQVDYARLSETELDELEAGHERLRALHAKAAGIVDVGGG